MKRVCMTLAYGLTMFKPDVTAEAIAEFQLLFSKTAPWQRMMEYPSFAGYVWLGLGLGAARWRWCGRVRFSPCTVFTRAQEPNTQTCL